MFISVFFIKIISFSNTKTTHSGTEIFFQVQKPGGKRRPKKHGRLWMGGGPVKNEKNIFWRYVQINEWLFELRWFRVQQVLWPYCRYLESVRSTSLKIVHERNVQIWVLEKNFFRSRIFRISRFIVWAIKFSPHQHGHHDHIDPFHYHLEKYHRKKRYS